jgi:hypothetical protein
MIVEEFLKTYAEVLLHGSWLVVGIALVAGLLSSAICPFTAARWPRRRRRGRHGGKSSSVAAASRLPWPFLPASSSV